MRGKAIGQPPSNHGYIQKWGRSSALRDPPPALPGGLCIAARLGLLGPKLPVILGPESPGGVERVPGEVGKLPRSGVSAATPLVASPHLGGAPTARTSAASGCPLHKELLATCQDGFAALSLGRGCCSFHSVRRHHLAMWHHLGDARRWQWNYSDEPYNTVT